ncbi:MAG: dihydropteroate synthase [Cytophagaceae bacterium]|nr:dihydropteroate synthase [Cytophagaceae bacterium]|tara:strand:+ start:836 stop:1669 length:834 start_codon:yes stop_codon:yes gene_type:complete
MKSINCRGKLINLDMPRVMGVLNITPDSFYDGGKYRNVDMILAQAKKMLEDGATFIDVGGYSSRPGAKDISPEEEKCRIVPIIQLLVAENPEICISVDTFRAGVARAGIEAGAAIINDISGGMLDKNMLPTVASLKVPYVLMHMRGTPRTMKTLVEYDDVVREVVLWLSERISMARELGIDDIIADPGFGFAKTVAQNFEMLNKMEVFQSLDVPLLAGLSRKSTIYKTLGITADEALNGTTVLNTLALQKGASILRVHDVKEAMETIKLMEKVNTAP